MEIYNKDPKEWLYNTYNRWAKMSKTKTFIDVFGWEPEVVFYTGDLYDLTDEDYNNFCDLVKDNCTDRYIIYNLATIAFEHETDAIAFKLKWS